MRDSACNVFREGTTVHRGTAGGGALTRIGSQNLFMAQVHVAHDCRVGSHTILANGSALSGHVEVQDHATLGGYSGVHQFCRVGTHAFMGGATFATRDVAPYSLTVGNRAHFFGLNLVGLRRRGFTPAALAALRQAFRLLQRAPGLGGARPDRGGRPPHRRGPGCGRVRTRLEARGDPRPATPRRGGRRGLKVEPLGLIAGNGRFPFLAAAGARRAGRRGVALALREETSPDLEREVDEIHWIGLGQLGRGILKVC